MRRPMRCKLSRLFIFFLLLTACSSDPSKKILGTWQETAGDKIVVEFLDDGTFSLKRGIQSMSGKWSILGDGRLKIEVSAFGMTQIQTAKIQFDGDQLLLTDEKGETTRHIRIK